MKYLEQTKRKKSKNSHETFVNGLLFSVPSIVNGKGWNIYNDPNEKYVVGTVCLHQYSPGSMNNESIHFLTSESSF